MPRLSLTARAFLLSFVPICILLATSFWALSFAVQQRVRVELRQSLQATDSVLNSASLEYQRRTSALISELTDSAGLKAAVGLIAETRGDAAAENQVRATIENQLAEMKASSGFDLLAVSNRRGTTIAVVGVPHESDGDVPLHIPGQDGLATLAGSLYQLRSVPVEIEGETVATLTLGIRFNIRQLPLAGDAVLLEGRRILQSTLPPRLIQVVEGQSASLCPGSQTQCEASFLGETFLVSELERAHLGLNYRLLGFRSLDARVRAFDSALIGILMNVGVAGIAFALLSAYISARSVSGPIRDLVSQLNHGREHGEFPNSLRVTRGVQEIEALAKAFNEVADAERMSRAGLETAKIAAETANRLKAEFLNNVSHELRTPMNGVLGMTDLLLESPLESEQREYAEVVRSCADSLKRIIDDMLDFSHLESVKPSLGLHVLDLGRTVREAVEEIRQAAIKKGVAVELSDPAVFPFPIAGDGPRIRQVLRLLLDNAVKFTEAGYIRLACIVLSNSPESADVQISIEDTGIGIAPEMHDFIFQKFTQADGSLTRRHGGTGMGLALAKEIVEWMDGKIGVESCVGKGSRFWFALTLPRAKMLSTGDPTVTPSESLV